MGSRAKIDFALQAKGKKGWRKSHFTAVTHRHAVVPRIAAAGLLVAAFGSPAFPQGRPSDPGLQPAARFSGAFPIRRRARSRSGCRLGTRFVAPSITTSERSKPRARWSSATGTRRIAFSELLPNLSATLSEARRKTNLEAFGFPLGPGFPRVVGPYNVVDARLTVTQTAFDLSAINEARSESHNVAAAGHSYRSARETVVLVTANLYLQTLASAARADTSRAQLATAEALYTQAQDLKQSGIIAGIDVIRADVRLRMDRQRRTAAENDFEKAKLQLARVIGLPLGQVYSLSDSSLGPGSGNHTGRRARARVPRPSGFSRRAGKGAGGRSQRASVLAEALPSLHITADYGAIGLTSPLRPVHVQRDGRRRNPDLPGGPDERAPARSRRRSPPAPGRGR